MSDMPEYLLWCRDFDGREQRVDVLKISYLSTESKGSTIMHMKNGSEVENIARQDVVQKQIDDIKANIKIQERDTEAEYLAQAVIDELVGALDALEKAEDTDKIDRDTIIDAWYEIEPHIKTIRTALKLLADPDMVLVPRRLTDKMAEAARVKANFPIDTIWDSEMVKEYADYMRGLYTAMIEAYEGDSK